MPIPYYPGSLVTPNFGLSLVGMEVELAQNFVIIDSALGGGGGTGNITGTLTPGIIPVATGLHSIGDGSITDDGAGHLGASPTTFGSLTFTGFDVFTVNTNSQITLTSGGTFTAEADGGNLSIQTGGSSGQDIVLSSQGLAGGNITMDALTGISITANSDILIESDGGDVDIFSTTGDINLGAIGSVAINSTNGLVFFGNISGSAAINVAAAAGTPNTLLLPLTTGTSGQVLSTDGGNPQQLSWISIGLGGPYVQLNPSANQTITGAHDLQLNNTASSLTVRGTIVAGNPSALGVTGTIQVGTPVSNAAALDLFTSSSILALSNGDAVPAIQGMGAVVDGAAYGIVSFANVSSTADIADGSISIYADGDLEIAPGTTLTSFTAYYANYGLFTAGTVTDVWGLYLGSVINNGVITRNTGIFIDNMAEAFPNAPITSYAIHTADQGSSSSAYSIFSEGGRVFLGKADQTGLVLGGSSSGSVTVQVAAAAGTSHPLVLPTTTGTSGQVLSTNGGNPQQLSWISVVSSVLWNQIGNAAADLTLANTTFKTTFNQTSAVTWLWANVTAATNVASQSSPILSLSGQYWTGAASAADGWSLEDVIGNGTNGTSTLSITQSGTSGYASVLVGTDLLMDMTGSSTTTPRTIGSTNQAGGQAIRLSLGDANTGIQNGFGLACTWYNYWPLIISGGRQQPGPGFVTGSTGDPGLIVISSIDGKVGMALRNSGSQSADMIQIQNQAGNVVQFSVGPNGNVTTYKTIATVSGGVPAEYATVDLLTQAASIGTTTLYAVPAAGAGVYRITYYMKVTQAATTSGSVTLTLTYTDRDDSTSISFVVPTPANATNSTSVVSGTLVIDAKLSTDIQYATTYASTGATPMQYKLRLKAEAL